MKEHPNANQFKKVFQILIVNTFAHLLIQQNKFVLAFNHLCLKFVNVIILSKCQVPALLYHLG